MIHARDDNRTAAELLAPAEPGQATSGMMRTLLPSGPIANLIGLTPMPTPAAKRKAIDSWSDGARGLSLAPFGYIGCSVRHNLLQGAWLYSRARELEAYRYYPQSLSSPCPAF